MVGGLLDGMMLEVFSILCDSVCIYLYVFCIFCICAYVLKINLEYPVSKFMNLVIFEFVIKLLFNYYLFPYIIVNLPIG